MSGPNLPLPIPEDAGDPAALLESLQTPHPEESVNLGGVMPAPEPGGDSDAEKLARAKPGRKRSPVSKHRTKPELLQTARELEAENAKLKTQLGQGESPTGPGPLGMSTQEVDRAIDIALSQTIELASNVAAAYFGPPMLIPKEERDIVRDAWLPIVRYYAPRMGVALPWVSALAATAMVVLPRVNMAREARATAKPAQLAEPRTDTTQGQNPLPAVDSPRPALPEDAPTRPARRPMPTPAERAAYTGKDPVAPPTRIITKDGQEQKL